MWPLFIASVTLPYPSFVILELDLTLLSALSAGKILNFVSRKHWRGTAGRGDFLPDSSDFFFLLLCLTAAHRSVNGFLFTSPSPSPSHSHRNFSDKHWTKATPSLWGLNFIPVGVLLSSFFLPRVPSLSSRLSLYLLFLLLQFSSPLSVLHSLLPDNLLYWIFKLVIRFLFTTGYWMIYFIHAKYLLISFTFSESTLGIADLHHCMFLYCISNFWALLRPFFYFTWASFVVPFPTSEMDNYFVLTFLIFSIGI